MAKNFTANPGSGGDSFAADEATAYGALAKIPLSKLDIGADGVSSPVTAANPMPVSGTFWQATQPVSGPLTDAQLRASAVPVSTAASYAEDSPHTSGAIGNLMLAIRSDGDTPTADNGDYTVLKLDEEGRLKVATKPASYPATTGNVTNATSTIPVNTERFSNLMIHCTGTFGGVNVTFEGSLNSTNGTDGAWFGVQAIRSNANTIETTTGVLGAAPAYAWELSVNALKYFRVRATAWVSGTQVWTMIPGTYATEPIPGAQISGTQPVSGTVTANIGTGALAAGTNAIGDVGIQYRANATGAATTLKFAAAASVNNALVLTGARRLLGWSLTNTTASFRYFRFYNKATAPTSGESPTFMVGLPPNSTVISPPVVGGIAMGLGLGIACTAGVADTDATVTVANDVVGAIHYA